MSWASGARYQRVQTNDWSEEEEEKKKEEKVTIYLHSASARSLLSRQKRETCLRITASMVLLCVGLYFGFHVLRYDSLEAPEKGNGAKGGKAHHGPEEGHHRHDDDEGDGHHHPGNKVVPAHRHEHGVYHHAAVITDSGGVISAVFHNKTSGTTKALNALPTESLNMSWGVPSTLQGLRLMHREYGSLSWTELFQRPAKLAREGFPIDHALAKAMRDTEGLGAHLCPLLCHRGRPLKEGMGMNATNERLANVLEEVSAEMEGASFPESLAWQLARDMPMPDKLAFVEALKRQRAALIEPLVTELDRFFLYVPPSPAAGAVTTEIVERAGQLGLSLASVSGAANASDTYRHVLNAAEQIYKSYPGFLGLRPGGHQERREGKPSLKTAQTGSHVTVIDASGNVLAMVGSLNSTFGAKFLSPSTGIFFSDFTWSVDSAVLYWTCPAVLTAMAGDRLVAVASAGGASAPFSVAQVVLNKVYFERSAREAVAGPRFYLSVGEGGVLHKRVSGLRRESEVFTLLSREEPELEVVNGTASGVTVTVVESHLGHTSAFGQPRTCAYVDGY
ncbi:glutathione hydrolase 6 isoform X2 [Heptranchias perlo]|uniref:glutathione hydrolase 6 isoform X2 n=1 Tax=Heptranchias perlo TaxID=212740 RepID=UPI003559CF45